MKILGRNSHNLSSDAAVRDLQDIQGRVKADVVFIAKCHILTGKWRAESVHRKLGFNVSFFLTWSF
jgi:hypothetical protein